MGGRGVTVCPGLSWRTSLTETLAYTGLTLWVVWVFVAIAVHHATLGDAWAYLLAGLTGASGVILGRWFGGVERMRSAAMILALALLLLASATFWGGAGGGLLGYSNANAALTLQVLALAALSAMDSRQRVQWLGLLAVAVAALAVLLTLSRAGGALLIPMLGAALIASCCGVRGRRWPLVMGVASTVVAAGGVVWLAGSANWPPLAARAFDEARRALWSDALELWAASPVLGSGPGSFADISLLAADPDTRRVHMSVLQVGSELGVVGVVLFALLVTVVFVLATRGSASVSLIAVTAVSVLLLHSFVDHVLKFPPVMLAAGTVVGWASRSAN